MQKPKSSPEKCLDSKVKLGELGKQKRISLAGKQPSQGGRIIKMIQHRIHFRRKHLQGGEEWKKAN